MVGVGQACPRPPWCLWPGGKAGTAANGEEDSEDERARSGGGGAGCSGNLVLLGKAKGGDTGTRVEASCEPDGPVAELRLRPHARW